MHTTGHLLYYFRRGSVGRLRTVFLHRQGCDGDQEMFELVMEYTTLYIYVTRSRKRGPFPQKSDYELDLSADSAKSVVHARENRLTLARSVPKLQSFEYHTRAYLGFEISTFISVL